ncbi:MAG: hypothetical protein KGS46_15925 [Chloroflexi bacterium]|nr:hypothetical protein [Chloroflexota bacterium]
MFQEIFKNANINHYPVSPYYSPFSAFGNDYATNVQNGERLDYQRDIWSSDYIAINRNGITVGKIYRIKTKLLIVFSTETTMQDRRVIASLLPSSMASMAFKHIDAINMLLSPKRLVMKELDASAIASLFN